MENSRSGGSGSGISEKEKEKAVGATKGFFRSVFADKPLPFPLTTCRPDFHSDLVRGLVKLRHLRRGHVSCLLSVKPAVTNFFGSLHGGAVAAVAETLSLVCARTLVPEDKDLFLGELSISYLSGAPQHAEVIVDVSVVRSGRNLTVTALEFKLKETGKLVYTARATFYNMPVAKL